MAEENLGEIYVKIRADVSNLDKELAQLKTKLAKESTEMGKKLSFKTKFDNSIAVFRLTELQKLREKLQREFDKKVSINVSSSSLDRTREKLAAVDARLRGVGDSAQKTGGMFSNAFGKGLIMAGGVTALFTVLKNSIQAARESAIAQAQVTQAVRTTGMAAGITAKELFGLADELQKLTAIDNDTILTSITNNLLTFRNVSGDVFKRAQLAVLDLNAVIAKGEIGALTSQTIQLGKALNDPVQGISALTRVGISFTEQQKEQIKTLTENGNLFEAQSVILREIEGQYGGQAKILALADGGFKKLNQSIDDVSEAIGNDLVGSATEGNGDLQELADGFLGVNEAIKDVNQGIGLFGSFIDGLKNIVTGGRGILDTAFNIKGQYKAAKEQYIKDMQEATKKTKEFYNTLGISIEPVKLTPITPQLDTTFGDEILANYQQQKVEITQLQNKIGQLKKGSEERLALEKELSSILDKQKDKTVTAKFESQIPSGYTAQQVAEFEKLKFAVQGYVDFRTAQIENTYKQEIDKAKGNAVEIAKAEENKILAVARFNQEMIDLQKEGSDATNKIVIDSLKEREKELESDLEREAQLEADNYTKRQDVLKNFYDQSSVLSENYFQYKIQKLAEESAALLEATGDPLIAKQLEIEGMKALEQEYFDWKVEMWRQQAGIFAASLDGLAAGYDTFWQSLANADITGAERIQQVWDAIKGAVLQSIGEIIKGYILNMIQAQVVGDALKAAELGKGIALGGSLAAAYAPAAAFASIMSFGGAAAAGSAGLVTTVALAKALAIPSFSNGGDFIVPSGYPNDSYPMLVESGERVTVTPSGQSGPGGLSGGDVDRIVNAIKAMNMNLIDKDFSVAVVNNSPDVKTTVRRGEKIKTQLTRQGAKLSER